MTNPLSNASGKLKEFVRSDIGELRVLEVLQNKTRICDEKNFSNIDNKKYIEFNGNLQN